MKALIANIPFSKAIKKAQYENPTKYKIIKQNLEELSMLEENNCAEIDEVADVFGKLMEEIASPDFIKEEETKRVLKFLGYNLGRWIYILDAFDDMEEDIKNKSYNPLLLQYRYKAYEDIELFKQKVKESIENSLTFTLESISKSFELLHLNYNKEIVENIILLKYLLIIT